MTGRLSEQIKILKNYSACDVSDALLKLEKPGASKVARAGYLADIIPFAPASPFTGGQDKQPKVIAPASTLKLVDKKDTTILPIPSSSPYAIPQGSHWVDNTIKGSILVIEQPSHHTCAAIGGIMATRMVVRGLHGCLVGGRVRDLTELEKAGLPVWALGRSTVGTGAEGKAYAHNIPVTIQDVTITPGDLIFCDPVEGVVVIPQKLIAPLIELMPKLVAADDKVKEAVEAGSSVQSAFAKFRTFDPSK